MTGRVELKTERLLLRPFKLEDVDDVYAYAKDPEWAEYLPGIPQPGPNHCHRCRKELPLPTT